MILPYLAAPLLACLPEKLQVQANLPYPSFLPPFAQAKRAKSKLMCSLMCHTSNMEFLSFCQSCRSASLPRCLSAGAGQERGACREQGHQRPGQGQAAGQQVGGCNSLGLSPEGCQGLHLSFFLLERGHSMISVQMSLCCSYQRYDCTHVKFLLQQFL